MNNEFWNFNRINKNNIALIDESEHQITYEQLNDAIDQFILELPSFKSLIFLKVKNTYKSIVGYLACLRGGHPFLLIDSKIESSLLAQLIDIYEPNCLIEELTLTGLNKVRKIFHTDLAMLLSTSGSTGTPKLVRLSTQNIISNTLSIVEYLAISERDCAITMLPMNYSFGMSIINTHLCAGARIVLNDCHLFDQKFWERVKTYHVTTLTGVPFSYQLLKRLDYSRFDTSSVRYLTQAGGKLDVDTLRYFSEKCAALGQKFIVMYGQTEASPRISYVPAKKLSSKIGSIGIAVPNGRLFLNDSYDVEITTPFVEGQLTYSGPNVMLGYAENCLDLQKGNTQQNVLSTGDIGYFDDDQFFYITGRIKRFIKLFGLRISLDAIDNWLLKNEIQGIAVGKDDLLVICYELGAEKQATEARKKIACIFQINISHINTVIIDKIPRINGGKVDYKTLNSLAIDKS